MSRHTAETDCVAGHVGLELANVALTRRDLHRSLPGVREKSLVRKRSVNARSSAEITTNRHFRVRVLSPQPRSRSLRCVHELNDCRSHAVSTPFALAVAYQSRT